MADQDAINFFSNSANGTSSDFTWRGGWMAFMATATFGGGSVKLQILTPAGVAIDFPSGSLSAAGVLLLHVPEGQVRAVAATGSAFYCWGIPIRDRVRP